MVEPRTFLAGRDEFIDAAIVSAQVAALSSFGAVMLGILASSRW